MGVSGGAPKKPTSDIIFPARFNEQGSDAERWIFGMHRMSDSKDARTYKRKKSNLVVPITVREETDQSGEGVSQHPSNNLCTNNDPKNFWPVR